MSDAPARRWFVPSAWVDGAVRVQLQLLEEASGVPLTPEERAELEARLRPAIEQRLEGFAAAAAISLFRGLMGR